VQFGLFLDLGDVLLDGFGFALLDVDHLLQAIQISAEVVGLGPVHLVQVAYFEDNF
jgi:hypothetical protein